VAVTLLAWSAAWLFAGSAWRIDLLANLSAQGALATLGALVWWAAWRRWALVGAAGAALALFAAGIVPGRARLGEGPAERVVRLLEYNAYLQGDGNDAPFERIMSSGADVVALVEPNWPLVRKLEEEGGDALATYPHRWPRRIRVGSPCILSRWPLEGLRTRYEYEEDEISPGASPRSAIVSRPGGAFILMAVHPASPRTRETWMSGKEAIEQLCAIVMKDLAPLDLPVLIAGDFNATASGWRSRALHARTGLRRCKPWWKPVGTWPGDTLWPARLAIDDVFVPTSARVKSWRTLAPAPGGDHSPVVVEVVMPESREWPAGGATAPE
jgi:endonuclease/exonuclease/phosphatase (EEP) superfamily protein YafD